MKCQGEGIVQTTNIVLPVETGLPNQPLATVAAKAEVVRKSVSRMGVRVRLPPSAPIPASGDLRHDGFRI
jgi:hypothetical protein